MPHLVTLPPVLQTGGLSRSVREGEGATDTFNPLSAQAIHREEHRQGTTAHLLAQPSLPLSLFYPSHTQTQAHTLILTMLSYQENTRYLTLLPLHDPGREGGRHAGDGVWWLE